MRYALLALLALSLIAGSFLPQLPPEMSADSGGASADRWMSATAARYDPWGTFLRAGGFLDIAHSIWFRVLLALLAFHVLISTADAAHSAWVVLGGRGVAVPDPPGSAQRATASLEPPLRDAADALHSRMEEQGMRVLREEAGDSATFARLYGVRSHLGVLGRVLTNVGALVLLLGLFLGSAAGWRTGLMLLTPGEETALGHGTALSLSLGRGMPASSGRQLLFHSTFGQVVALPLGPAQPACHGGICAHFSSAGPALTVEGRDAEERPVVVQPLNGGTRADNAATLAFDQPQAERHVTLPSLNLALRIVAQNAALKEQGDEHVFLVQAYEGGSLDPVVHAVVAAEPTTLPVGEARILLQPETYSVVQVVYAPELTLLLTGGALILCGIALPLIWPTLQVWVELTPGRRSVSVTLLGRAHSAFVDVGLELERLTGSLRGMRGREA
jgi:hypothetical protein